MSILKSLFGKKDRSWCEVKIVEVKEEKKESTCCNK